VYWWARLEVCFFFGRPRLFLVCFYDYCTHTHTQSTFFWRHSWGANFLKGLLCQNPNTVCPSI
jgi:hypothetical protein